MNKELDDKLCKKYPNLYRNRNRDPMQTCMFWGFPGDGWYNLLDELSAILEPMGVIADQVKEKFGGLRFYYHGAHIDDMNKVDAAIDRAEVRAKRTCEVCGEPGRTCGYSYIQTLCDQCKKERHVDKNKIMART